ncbi:DNA alkylation repair protein [Chitinophaga eiseniae]|uniref:DNA alkylation repair protein n=1 Tax=Chitinophaga eiseniae TaxID=634771 RepID=A0A847STA6_9BACT|nr:DNA alkylation repair protein [Chitinophaga eiseniae]NLR80926.1 DNA alkylation repair protein [Chitinophaga eiseniae]
MLSSIIAQLKKVEHGFKHIMEAGDELMKNQQTNHFNLAVALLSGESYQERMLGTYLLGLLAPENREALRLLETKVAADDNWRVQEMLAKAIDHYCQAKGYEKSLPDIRRWLQSSSANVNRAVVEGLRVWTRRPYFKDHPEVAIGLISPLKSKESEYLRKSVGNALRDISKKNAALVQQETDTWELGDPVIAFVYKLIVK